MSDSDRDGLVKVLFRMVQDEDGYPPVTAESMWARPLGGGEYELDNVPFFARGVAAGDVVAAEDDGDMPVFQRLVRAGGHSTLRIIFYDDDAVTPVLQACVALGCTWEQSHIEQLCAVDVPPTAPLGEVIDLLKREEAAERLAYEEGCLARR